MTEGRSCECKEKIVSCCIYMLYNVGGSVVHMSRNKVHMFHASNGFLVMLHRIEGKDIHLKGKAKALYCYREIGILLMSPFG